MMYRASKRRAWSTKVTAEVTAGIHLNERKTLSLAEITEFFPSPHRSKACFRHGFAGSFRFCFFAFWGDAPQNVGLSFQE